MISPFMEHPSGEFKSAIDAMADAIKRLRALGQQDEWITFCAQGMGYDEDSYHMAEIRVRQDELELNHPHDVTTITKLANIPKSKLRQVGANYSIQNASPEEASRIMDAIFKNCLGIRPHLGEGNDYAVGAEW